MWPHSVRTLGYLKFVSIKTALSFHPALPPQNSFINILHADTVEEDSPETTSPISTLSFLIKISHEKAKLSPSPFIPSFNFISSLISLSFALSMRVTGMLPLYTCFQGVAGVSYSCLSGQRHGTPWMSRQLITGPLLMQFVFIWESLFSCPGTSVDAIVTSLYMLDLPPAGLALPCNQAYLTQLTWPKLPDNAQLQHFHSSSKQNKYFS